MNSRRIVALLLIAVVMAAFPFPAEGQGGTGRGTGTARSSSSKPSDTPKILEDKSFLANMARVRGKITVVAPGSGLRSEKKTKVFEVAETLGLNLPAEALGSRPVPYHAAADEARERLLFQALNDPKTDIVWALRGGYGSARLLPALAARPLTGKPKIFIGYSDMTFLHLFLQQRGWKTVHGAMFLEMFEPGKDEDNYRLLAALLAGRLTELRYDDLRPFNQAARDLSQPVRAVVTGGNLTSLAAAAGTPWPLEAAGKILFVEDVEEPGYKLDRLFTQLRLAGQLEGVRAIVLGEFSRGDENTERALERFGQEFAGPIFRTDRFGHGAKNHPLIFNAPAVLKRNSGDGGLFTLSIEAKP